MIRTLVLALVLTACRGRDDREVTIHPAPAEVTPNRPDHVIGGNVIPQSHELPAGRATEIRALFESGVMSYPIAVVSAQGAQTQFVNPKPVFVGDHRFVVGAPPNVHKAIDALIAGMEKRTAPVSSTYELTYWIVEAAEAPKMDVPRDLAGSGLEKLTALGNRRFKLLDRVTTRTREGSKTKATGRLTNIEHRLASSPDGIELELDLELSGTWSDKPDKGPRVETTLQLPIDQPVVVGDSALATASDGVSNLLLYVVRARRVE